MTSHCLRLATPGLAARRRGGLALALSFVSASAGAAPAGPQTPPLTVLELEADSRHETDAQTLTNELRQAVIDAPEHALHSSNPALVIVAGRVHCDLRPFDQFGPDSDRGIDEACQRRMAARLDVRRLLWGHLYEQNGTLFAKAHLYREGAIERVVTVPFEPAARARVARRLYAKLVTPERVGDVRVQGDASFAGAELYAGSVALGPFTPGVEMTLASGPLVLEARREGRVLARAKGVVAAEGMTEMRLVFEPRTDLDPAAGFRDPPSVVTSSSDWKRTAGFISLGLGATLIGAGVLATVRVNGMKDDFDSDRGLLAYRAGMPSDACQAAERSGSSSQPGAASANRFDRLCSSAAAFEVAQYMFYGTGALAVGAGVYLLVTSYRAEVPSAKAGPGARGATWSVRPWGGLRAGGMGLDVTF
jgi:hypothetical protein